MKYNFNNKFLKDNSKPGSFRRGYETFQKGLVEDVKFNQNIVRAKVKGTYKPYYETGIKFTKSEVRPICNCPLEEPWCKHAIALAFVSLKNHYFEEFQYEKLNIEPVLEDENLEMNPNPEGDYIFKNASGIIQVRKQKGYIQIAIPLYLLTSNPSILNSMSY